MKVLPFFYFLVVVGVVTARELIDWKREKNTNKKSPSQKRKKKRIQCFPFWVIYFHWPWTLLESHLDVWSMFLFFSFFFFVIFVVIDKTYATKLWVEWDCQQYLVLFQIIDYYLGFYEPKVILEIHMQIKRSINADMKQIRY